MPVEGYFLGTHRDVARLVPQLTALSNTAFAEYDGAMPVEDGFMQWYLQRPGSRPELCPAALYEGELVANVLVAIQDLYLGGELLRCGIIDTVATHPDHRKHGLARALMEEAHRLMQEAGAEAAVLYTNPDGHPYRFYQRLGYLPQAMGAALSCRRPASQPARAAEEATVADESAVRALLDEHYRGCGGYAPMVDDLWRWHRRERPVEMPIQLVVVRGAAGLPVAALALAEVELLLEGNPVPASVMSDFACAPGEDPQECLQALLSMAPTEEVLAIVDVTSPEHALLQGLGAQTAVREASLALPFTDRAREALASSSRYWYFMIESLVGV